MIKKLAAIFSSKEPTAASTLDYCQLEPRRLLNADFFGNAFGLNLDDFETNTDVIVSQVSTDELDQPNTVAFRFELTSGNWEYEGGLDGLDFAIDGADLFVAISLFEDPAGPTDPTLAGLMISDTLGFDPNVTFATGADFADNTIEFVGVGDIGQDVGGLEVKNLVFSDAADLSQVGNVNLDQDDVGQNNNFTTVSGTIGGQVQLVDNGGLEIGNGGIGLTIAGGGQIESNSPLTINADVNTNASMTFIAGSDVNSADDDLTIDGAAITLNSTTAATLTFEAGDDIVFINDGQVITTGGDPNEFHTVNLFADQEDDGTDNDNDQGSVSNSDENNISVQTDFLVVDARNGIGFDGISGIAFRIQVDQLSASNSNGCICIEEADNLILADLDADGYSIKTTDDDVTIAAGGSVEIIDAIDVGNAAVRIAGNGDIHQGTNGTITATELAVRQEALIGSYVATADLDANGLYDICLAYDNVVDEFAAFNAFQGGSVTFNNTQNLTIGSILGSADCDIAFATTTGVVTTDNAAGPFTNDIQIDADGYLFLDEQVNAGNADVRLRANGDIHQDAEGIITANELGVYQASNTYVATADIDANTYYDICLAYDNVVDEFAAFNNFEGGSVTFNNTQNLTIGEVSTNDKDNALFPTTTGVVTTDNAAGPFTNDIQIDADGYLFLDEQVNAGNADVRLRANGDIHQDAEGIITANELGVYQASNTYVATADIDANTYYDICLAYDNVVDEFAAFNNFEGGSVTFNNTQNLTIGEVSTNDKDNALFPTTTGVVTTDNAAGPFTNDIQIDADGYLFLDEQVNAGNADVRLRANGDIHQDAEGIITANELGVYQASNTYVATADIDANTYYDICLAYDNVVDEFAAFNNFEGGSVTFNNTQNLTLGEVSTNDKDNALFPTTTGVVTTDNAAGPFTNDIQIDADGYLFLDEQVNAGNADVRLRANGDIHQDAEGIITANELGVYQASNTYVATADIDANTYYDICLAYDNVVDEFAAFNNFEGGSVTFNNTQNLTLGEVSTNDKDNALFPTTTGVVTTDNAAGPFTNDIQVDADGYLFLDEQVNAGNADVRLRANGDIHQDAEGIITANELGVYQASNTYVATADIDANTYYDICLAYDNVVDEFAAFNAFQGGSVTFNNTQNLTLGSLTAVDKDNATFATTTGVVTTDNAAAPYTNNIQIDADGYLFLDEQVNAGNADVRLRANGDIHQDAEGIITANELGVYQASNTYVATADIDANTYYDICLAYDNVVDEFAAFNAFQGGSVTFNNTQNLTLGSLTAVDKDNATFATTTGVVTTDNAAAPYTNNIQIDADGYLFLDEQVNAGNADVRLRANGDIHQDAEGIITANELGVYQASNTYVATADIDANTYYDICLAYDNVVDEFAAFNAFQGGSVTFNNTQNLTLGSLTAVDKDNATFATTTGVVTTDNAAAPYTNDIQIDADGYLFLDEQVNAGNADVRLRANGDIHQDAEGIITANELGVYQASNTYVATADIDANTYYDICLAYDNVVDEFAAFNAFQGGSVTFNNTQNLTLGSLTAVDKDNATFATTTGVVTTDNAAAPYTNDIQIDADGYLFLDEQVNAGNADVRLRANGDIHQDAEGIITANELGVYQASNTYVATADIDANTYYDICLAYDNVVDEFAAFNAFQGGSVTFNNTQNLTLGSLTAVDKDNATFATTTGVVTTDNAAAPYTNDIQIDADGYLFLDEQVNAGNADVRLRANGDIHQDAEGIITANELGVVQASNTYVASADLDANGVFDICLAYDTAATSLVGNMVDELASFNAFADGSIEFNNLQTFSVDTVTSVIKDNAEFGVNVALDDVEGVKADDNIFLKAGDNSNDARIVIVQNISSKDDTAASQVLLQASGSTVIDAGRADLIGVVQDANSVIYANQLMVGGPNDFDGTGAFYLQGFNQVDELAGDLQNGSLHFVNHMDLTIKDLTFTSVCHPDVTFANLYAGFESELDQTIALTNRINAETLVDTLQATYNGQGGAIDINPNFDTYLRGQNVGIAIQNTGSVTVNANQDMSIQSTVGDIYVETKGNDGDLTIKEDKEIEVENADANLTLVASQELTLEDNAKLFRDKDANPADTKGLVTNIITTLEIVDPLANFDPNAAVIINFPFFKQFVDFRFGTDGDKDYDSTIFWGFVGKAADFDFNFDNLTTTQLVEIKSLLDNNVADVQEFYAGLLEAVVAPDTATLSTDDFTIAFLRNNPEFFNVQFIFNDPGINIFEQSEGPNGPIDLNVASEDFPGIVNDIQIPVSIPVDIPAPPPPVQIPVLIAEPDPVEVEEVPLVDEPLPVEIDDKYFIVAFFENEVEAERFDKLFQDDEIDLEQLRRILNGDEEFDKKDFARWIQTKTGKDVSGDDVNEIIQQLEKAKLKLDADDLNDLKEWLQNDKSGELRIPRGILKIIFVNGGDVTLEGDDIDRRLVPEGDKLLPKDNLDDGDRSTPETGPIEDASSTPSGQGANHIHDAIPIFEVAPVQAAPISHVDFEVGKGIDSSDQVETGQFKFEAATIGSTFSIGMLATRLSSNNRVIEQELESLSQIKQAATRENIFSRAARFSRRNESQE